MLLSARPEVRSVSGWRWIIAGPSRRREEMRDSRARREHACRIEVGTEDGYRACRGPSLHCSSQWLAAAGAQHVKRIAGHAARRPGDLMSVRPATLMSALTSGPRIEKLSRDATPEPLFLWPAQAQNGHRGRGRTPRRAASESAAPGDSAWLRPATGAATSNVASSSGSLSSGVPPPLPTPVVSRALRLCARGQPPDFRSIDAITFFAKPCLPPPPPHGEVAVTSAAEIRDHPTRP